MSRSNLTPDELNTLIQQAREGEAPEALQDYLGQGSGAIFPDYDKYILFNPNHFYENPSFKTWVLAFYDDLRLKSGTLRRKDRHTALRHLGPLVTNLLEAYFKAGENPPLLGYWVAYPRSDNKRGRQLLQKWGEGSSVTIGSLVQVADGMEETGYVRQVIGYNDRTGARDPRLSRMRAEPKLLDRLEEDGLFRLDIMPPFRRHSRHMAVLKTAPTDEPDHDKGTPLTGTDVPETTRKVLDRFNRKLARIQITTPPLDRESNRRARQNFVDATDKRLKRHFVGSTTTGVRMYNNFWQRMESDLRSKLLIGDEQVVEYDLQSCQLHLVYHLSGKNLWDHFNGPDPYQLPELAADRDLVKDAFVRVLNTDTDEGALGSLRNDYSNQDNDFQGIIEALRKHHPPIFEHRGKNAWVALNAVESEFTMEVIRRALGAGIVVLPIHDSLIAPRQHGEWLKQTMEDSLSSVGIISKPTVRLK